MIRDLYTWKLLIIYLSGIPNASRFSQIMDISCQKCGLVGDYNEQQSGPHKSAYCNGCGSYIKHLPQGKPITLYFGKYKDRQLSTLQSDDELNYLIWLSQAPGLNAKLKTAIDAHIRKS